VECRSSILGDVELRKTKGKRELLNLESSINALLARLLGEGRARLWCYSTPCGF
jgi:hypothetical protein